MAKTNRREILEFELTLSEEEAEYLHDLLQNFIAPDGNEEPIEHTKIRSAIFNELHMALNPENYRF